jgi:hypothetical protein
MKVRRRYNSKSGDVYYTVGYSKVYHREDGPAIISGSGTKYWFRYGLLHRSVGPATELSGGTKIWFNKGKRHRLDGPAVIYPEGGLLWCINDKEFKTKEEWFESLPAAAQQVMLFSEYFVN